MYATTNAKTEDSQAFSRPKPTDYYNPHETPPLPSSGNFAYDSPLADHDADAASAAASLAKSQAQARRDASRKEKFIECLSKDTVDIAELRKHAWAGIPAEVRPIAWQLLLGYLPAVSSRRISVLARKRQEYADAVKQAFARGEASLDAAIWHQIKIDVPRTNPGVPLWQFASTQASLEKILYVWAIRHPASGYVQGINDLATPFYQVFLSSYIDCDPEDYDISALPPEALLALEADTFWCLSKLLDGIQDNYIFAQPGIHRQVARCQELCARVDAPLAKHLESEGVSFLQFSFRWFHLLFLRVLPVNSVIRMWDTYMSEGSDAFANFHTYVCLAFLLRWSEKLRSMDFQAIMLFLQEPVDHETWTESSTELLLSEAYMWSALWSGSKQTK
ncbi:RabGAP/TBC [Cystobasidium minutum MCA 4210]|uniref:RabGAP/TBC n=1 Tax=Cystobasidium minutum MCA 4210 TaxID=1397322 RepID=UPI0034CE3785|eukprot:jgi/Rhomi1/15396/CE15395_547